MRRELLFTISLAFIALTALPLAADAVTPDVRHEYGRETELGQVFGNAMRVLELGPRTTFVVQRVKESTALLGVLVEPRQTHTFSAGGLLPKGMMKGDEGQIVGAALLQPDLLALAAGWTDAAEHGVRHGILILRRESSGWELETWFPVHNALDVAAGPGGTILITTIDWARTSEAHGTPTVELFDMNGRLLGTYFHLPADTPRHVASRDLVGTRLIQVGANEYGYYVPSRNTVRYFTIQNDHRMTVTREVNVLNTPAVVADRFRILGVFPQTDGSVTVVRGANVNGRGKTFITRYAQRGEPDHIETTQPLMLVSAAEAGVIRGLRKNANAVQRVEVRLHDRSAPAARSR